MVVPSPTYKRAPSEQLRALFTDGKILSPVRELPHRAVGGHSHDLHFRLNDEVCVYRGLTVVLKIQRYKKGGLKITPHANYTGESGSELLAAHRDNDVQGFREALNDYLVAVDVSDSHTMYEGHVQLRWSRVLQPWVPFDREARLNYRSKRHREESKVFPEVKDASNELTRLYNRQTEAEERWSKPKVTGAKLDQLAVDEKGRLVLLELKDASKHNAEVYYSPFQLLQYVWEWHSALEAVRNDLQAIIDSRIAVGLTPPDTPSLTGGIRAAVGFGLDKRSLEVKRRYGKVLEVVNQHLPNRVGPIETWAFTCTGPGLANLSGT